MAVFTFLWLGGFGKRSPRWKGLVSLEDRGQEKVSDSLELEFQVVGHSVTQVLGVKPRSFPAAIHT